MTKTDIIYHKKMKTKLLIAFRTVRYHLATLLLQTLFQRQKFSRCLPTIAMMLESVSYCRTMNDLSTDSDADLAASCYARDGVFMPTTLPTATGTQGLKDSYANIFDNIQLDVKFTIDELEVSLLATVLHPRRPTFALHPLRTSRSQGRVLCDKRMTGKRHPADKRLARPALFPGTTRLLPAGAQVRPHIHDDLKGSGLVANVIG